MAGEIQATYTTGSTLYAQVRNSVGQIWNTASSVFQAYVTANIADYDVAMTEQGTASGFYSGTFPTGITTAGTYPVTVYRRVGGSPAETDLVVAAGNIEWSGSVAGTAAAWGGRALGNGRTADMYLQGLVNKIEFAADGLTATLYSTDDVTPLKTFTATRNPLTLGSLKNLDPA